MEPSVKSPQMNRFLDRLFDRQNKIKSNLCTVCDGPVLSFKDELSRKEYTISGLCQECQDECFK
jgi:hypothetical protein